jgi:DNA polymerase-3 subunit alpha
MAAFSLEDEAAKVDAVVFPEAFSRAAHVIVTDAMVVARGKYERDEESSRLVVSEITPLEIVRHRVVRSLEIRLEGKGLAPPAMRALAGVLERHHGDRRVSFLVEVNGRARLRVRTATAHRVKPSDQLVRDVEAVCGAGTVILK